MVLFSVLVLVLSPVRFVSAVNAHENQDDCEITKKTFLNFVSSAVDYTTVTEVSVMHIFVSEATLT
jgi:hypothetical protein